jgi:preprotein translocase subunit YajC
MSSLVAAGSSSGGSGNLLIFALPVLLIGWMFYTQRRRTRETQRLQSMLGVGDEVTTTSGLLGRITALDGEIATLEVSPGVTVRFNRLAIAGPAATEPASPIEQAPSDSGTDTVPDPARETD